MNTSRAAIFISIVLGKISSIVGYMLAIIGVIGLAVELTEGSDTFGIVLSLIFLISGILAIVKGIQIKRRIRRFRRYVSLISTSNMVSLDNLAVATSQSVDFVRRDLQKMIDKKFFINASINLTQNEISIGQAITRPESVSSMTVSFTCTGCGAVGSKPQTAVANCAYCGTLNQ